ncbi:hypothetical protein [uncultured Alistipes sp.]|uniref:hypothetical protein n=1 Tax=uncultured Alistipes sp. TaxID=538949 RepID=UPI003220139B
MTSEIAACGLFCGACPQKSRGKCPGCRDNEKAVWQSCADCTTTTSDKCKVFNNFYAKLFSFIFRSDRQGCVGRIREVGYEAFAEEMRLAGRMNRPVTKK